ncbi:uncharacterized protein F5Z01DRAFT_618048 [Emericellopsis atlantica]|uniref:Potassium channel domain-containing protein n=1 Tax=Emericellopsis atlantica TaxID=2614577 RepID=A0A9P7ZR68_9HYPO|nr:uncharacterized protein F5Z01DRAFT_618048 [Emericellopsis atlantica]KAG9256808.1 hypothetical protein F5Z01DRAFT_618048 [Emericellopsis atlantica]
MNDGNLGDNIAHHAEKAESQLPQNRQVANDEAHLQPSRWWFASSAFPMIAGTLGPVASAFSICALCRPWVQYLPPDALVTEAEFVDDPNWLTVVNALQLAIAVVANAFLLLNMAKRVRFSIAQPITIVGWFTSSFMLIGLLGAASASLGKGPAPKDQYIWSQAFWYGIWAAILYFVTSSLMVVTFLGAWKDKYPKDFMLTMSQRTLMLQTVMFLVYLLLGALLFSHLEDWNYLDTVYWADVTLFTIGLGDYYPTTTVAEALLIPYAFIGIISLGLVIASIRSLMLERGRKRLDARIEERRRRLALKRMERSGTDTLLEPISEDRATPGDDDDYDGLPSPGDSHTPSNEYERRKAEFELMRTIQDKAATRRRWIALVISLGTWLLLWMVGAVIFRKFEKPYQGWTYFTGFYFCFTSLTTIGYGNQAPISPGGRSFFVFWSLLALPTTTVLISTAGDTVVKVVRDATISLGNVTILPGETPIMKELMHAASVMTHGLIFKSHLESPRKPMPPFRINVVSTSSLEEPPQMVDEHGPSDGEERGRQTSLDPESAGSQARETSTFTNHVRRSLSRMRDPLSDELPTGLDFQFLLISEIQVVALHIREGQSRKYSFEEWAWYLRLIGEDERDAATHRKPSPKDTRHRFRGIKPRKKADRGGSASPPEGGEHDGEHDKWSWVGHRSPLMGSQEESEWILDRLMNRLGESLSEERRKQLGNEEMDGPSGLERKGEGRRYSE